METDNTPREDAALPSLSARKIGTYATGSPEWHAARDGKMSGSRIAAAAGLSPWTSPYSLFAEMAGDIAGAETTPQMEWGTHLEAPVIDWFDTHNPGIRVIRRPGTWLNKIRPWQLANPDALLVLPSTSGRPNYAVLEVKTAAYSDGWGKEGTDEIPLHYLCQVYWYLDTLGLRFAIVAVLIGGNDYQEYLVELDDGAVQELRSIGREFLDRLETGTYPDLDGSSDTLRAIKERHPDIDGTSIDIPDWMGHELVHAKSRLVVPTERFGAVKNELAELMGDAKLAYWNGIKIADRRSRNGGTPYVQLASHLPAPVQVPSAPRERVSA